jgi:hypothetical protein
VIANNNQLPAGWTSQGCYLDTGNPRTLNAASFAGNTVTEESCVTFCNGKGYIYAGVEYSDECCMSLHPFLSPSSSP